MIKRKYQIICYNEDVIFIYFFQLVGSLVASQFLLTDFLVGLANRKHRELYKNMQ